MSGNLSRQTNNWPTDWPLAWQPETNVSWTSVICTDVTFILTGQSQVLLASVYGGRYQLVAMAVIGFVKWSQAMCSTYNYNPDIAQQCHSKRTTFMALVPWLAIGRNLVLCGPPWSRSLRRASLMMMIGSILWGRLFTLLLRVCINKNIICAWCTHAFATTV